MAAKAVHADITVQNVDWLYQSLLYGPAIPTCMDTYAGTG